MYIVDAYVECTDIVDKKAMLARHYKNEFYFFKNFIDVCKRRIYAMLHHDNMPM